MDEILTSFARFASELTYEVLPADVVVAGKQRLLDALGCAIGAYGCKTAEIGRSIVTIASRPELSGRLLGSSRVAAADVAAFVNSCMIRYMDFNDSMRGGGGHPSDMLGALFAVAPQISVSGKQLITAVVVAYELVMRIKAGASIREKGWDQGFGISVGACAGLANLMGLSRDATQHAIAMTAVANTPMRATRSGQLSMWKGAATAYAVRNAVFGVQLAGAGMTGPEAPFTGRHGFVELISGPLTLKPFGTARSDFFIANAVYTKLWPVSYGQQAIVWAGLELRKRVSTENLVSVAVQTYHFAWFESGSEPAKWDPKTRETADHSIPYVLARTLLHGVIDQHTFTPESYLDSSIRPLMRLITVSVDDELEREVQEDDVTHVRLIAKDKSGKLHEVNIINPLGHDKNPATQEEIERKFARLCESQLGKNRTEEAIEKWRNIETTNEIGRAFDAINVKTDVNSL